MKKGLKLFATGFLCMSALTLNVKADDVTSEETLKNCLKNDNAICKVTEEITIKESIRTTAKNVVLDLNGNKVNGPDDGKEHWYAFIVEDGSLTLKDSSSAQTGKLWAKCYGVETKGGTFIMESGKITATNNPTVGAAIVNYGGKAEIKGGTLVAASNWAVNAQSFFADAELVISGGTFEVSAEDTAAVQIGGEYTKGKETVTITGGTFRGKTSFAVSENANATVSITGGTFSNDVAEYVAEGYKSEEVAENAYKVSPIVYEITKGEDQSITVGKDNTVTITIDADFKLFKDLYINDKLVDKKYYTAKSGSTIITLNSEYTNTLEAGEYEITATFTDGGTATTKLTLVEKDNVMNTVTDKTEAKNPNTYDGIMTYIILTIISILGLAYTKSYISKKVTNY